MIFASFHQGKEEYIFLLLYVFQVLRKALGKLSETNRVSGTRREILQLQA
jgi:hypothetical protein